MPDYQTLTSFPATYKETGGRGGIRTHGGFNPTLDFESSALNRTQPPFPVLQVAACYSSASRQFCNDESVGLNPDVATGKFGASETETVGCSVRLARRRRGRRSRPKHYRHSR